MEFRTHQLENGLEIVAECNPQAHSLSLGYFVDAGSRDETEELSGVSHFLEHMVFKGTPNRTAEDVNRELDEMGSASNATTSEERTIYHSTILPEFQVPMVELLSDIMRPTLDEKEFETEKEVIIEEIQMYDDQPPFGGHERLMAKFLGEHPLGKSVLGTVDSVGNMSAAQMMGYFQQRYSPGNIKLIASGKVDFDELVSTAERCCGAWEPFAVTRDKSRGVTHPGFEIMLKEQATQEYVLQLSEGPAAESKDRFASRILSTIVGDDSGSRMFWEFIDPGIAEYAGMGCYEYQGTGLIMSVLCCQPDSTQANLELLAHIQQTVEADGVTEQELELAKRKISAHIILSSERPENRLFAVGANWMQRKEYKTVREIADAYQSVTLDDIHRVLAEYPLSRSYTLAVGPLEQLEPAAI